MASSDNEWAYLAGNGEPASAATAVSNGDAKKDEEAEVTGVADNGGSAVPAPVPAYCASGDATKSTTDDDDVEVDDCDCSSHWYNTDASEEDGISGEDDYSDNEGSFGTMKVDDYLAHMIDHDKDTHKKVNGAATLANVVVSVYPVGTAAPYATNEHPDDVADNDVSDNNDDCYHGYDGEVYQNYGYDHGSSYGYDNRAYLDGHYYDQAYYSGYQYQRRGYQPYYVHGAGMYPPLPVLYVYPHLYAYAYVPCGYAPPCAPMRASPIMVL